MAKRRGRHAQATSNQHPPKEPTMQAVETEVEETPETVQPTHGEAKAIVNYREIRVPLEEVSGPSFRLHVDISIQGEQALALRRLASGLDRNRVTLANGRRCTGANDAVRWLMEQICK